MELNQALHVAKPWAAGKTIWFYESDVLNAIINAIEGKSMLTPEDSARVAYRMIQAIERIESRAVILMNEVQEKLTLRTDINNAIRQGIVEAEKERRRFER